jgi:transposase
MDMHAHAMGEHGATTTMVDARFAALEVTLVSERAAHAAAREQLAAITKERDHLRAAHERLRQELELLKRRLFVAKAERIDTTQLEMEFAETLRLLDALGGTPATSGEDTPAPPEGEKKAKPTGRRDLRKLPLEEERIEIADPLYEELVAQGKAKRIGYEESCKLAWKRGGMRRLVIARAKYQVEDAKGDTAVDTAEMPPEPFPRSLAAPSLLAHILVEKYCDGLPLFRIEDRFCRDGARIDRGTLCRWVEDAGATCGATVIAAARKEAFATAFCIATDATGVAVQPVRTHDKARNACRRGHYFVHIADKDHVFFEYTAKETSAKVAEMFKGFQGYIQADAKSVYDVLFREPEHKPPDGGAPLPTEIGCWSHARRKYWEATCAKSVAAREGLARIGRIFELDASWKDKSPAEIKRLRDAHLRPHVEAFFAWAEATYQTVKDERGLLRTALGYSVRQKDALMRVFDDGRLVLDNNRSERQLRRIATGRKAWLFVGSDDHAEAAGHVLSLIASARLHALDPESYLCDFFRVLPHWPKDRYLELAPKYWTRTRARLVTEQLAREAGPLTIPPPLDAMSEKQPTAHGTP